VCDNPGGGELIFMKVYTGAVYDKFQTFQLGYTQKTNTLHGDLHAFLFSKVNLDYIITDL
jgi:hypothetical protein